uniref:Bet v I/Major latex protein domain-containing protein n=1 Tax=Ananas comosus var. bracteatus TaxID=296719 RepID=A0A6V7NYF1_ANACO|nr:unnamed protein product [Ananas comosus var. bracteatus]
MKTMRGEVVLSIPAKKAWEMFTNNEVLSKIEPDMLASAEYIQGDGTPGSLRLFKLGPALHGYVKESMQRIEKVEPGRCMSYRVVGGELRAWKENEQCIAEWKAEFEPVSPAVPPPEKAKEAALGFLKCFERSQLCI